MSEMATTTGIVRLRPDVRSVQVICSQVVFLRGQV